MGESAIASRTVEQWRARTHIPLTLKSGAQVEVKKPGLGVLINANRLPLSLVAKVASVQNGSDAEKLQALAGDNDSEGEAAVGLVKMIYALVADILTSPRVVFREEGDDTPLREGEVTIHDIPGDDLLELYQWGLANKGEMRIGEKGVSTEQMESFRNDETVSAHSTDGGEVRSETVPDSTDGG
ncbi:MAG: hypothetical protein QOH63_1989 [Acidobacteriota bacterium]|jgi:hypothetical protein|nr:hypothetical protein [Acidobacteriota bacterium]